MRTSKVPSWGIWEKIGILNSISIDCERKRKTNKKTQLGDEESMERKPLRVKRVGHTVGGRYM
jgi:hypothetical protein